MKGIIVCFITHVSEAICIERVGIRCRARIWARGYTAEIISVRTHFPSFVDIVSNKNLTNARTIMRVATTCSNLQSRLTTADDTFVMSCQRRKVYGRRYDYRQHDRQRRLYVINGIHRIPPRKYVPSAIFLSFNKVMFDHEIRR